METLFPESIEAGWNTTINLPSYTLAAKKCRELAREHEVRGPRKNGNGWFVYWRPKQKEDADMKEQAVKKLRDEMAVNSTNRFVQHIGNGLIAHLDKNPVDAEKVLDPEKTIFKSFIELRKEAETIPGAQEGICLLPDEVATIILKYFGITTDAAPIVPTPVTTNTTSFKLDDYL